MSDKVIEFYGRSIDLAKAMPLTLKDWMMLEKEGVSAASLAQGRVTEMAAVLYHVLHKADSTVTREEVESIPMTSPLLTQITTLISSEEGKIDRPFLATSTSSPLTTAGPPAT